MNLYIQPNRWSCLPTAFGIALGITPAEMFDMIGHDGSEIIWPNQEEPYKRRSFHPQEIIPICIANGIYPIEIENQCIVGLEAEDEVVVFKNKFLEKALQTRPGVLMVLHKESRHAIAWNEEEQKVYDPAGFKADLSEYEVLAFYAFY